MSTYLPNITDSLPELPLYQPNMGFFSQMLQKKSSQYEAGYSQVKSAYDSILNAPLSDEANISTRDEYIKSAKEKLKNLSATDLSLQQNVDEANNVFAPFWEDNMLLMDTAFTKSTQEEMQKGMRLRDSKNKEDRDQYSDIAMQYLANGLEPLKNAGRNPDAYKNLEKRRFTPFINEKEYWNTQAKNLNFEINWSEPSGPYLINTKNGQRAEQSFRAFAEGMISPQLENQYKVIGTVEKEGRIKQVKSMYPGVNDKQALDYIAKDVISDVRKNYKTAITGLTGESDSVSTKIEEFKKLGELTPAQTNRYNELRDYQDQLQAQIKLKNKEFEDVADDTSKNAIEVHNNILGNPDYYFTKLARSRSINNWAAAASSNTSKKIEINPVWKEQNDISYKQQTLALQNRAENRADAKLDLEERQFSWEKDHPKGSGKNSGGSLDAEGNYSPSKSDLERGDVLGTGTTDITKSGTALEMFRQRQGERLAVADESIYSMEGLGRIAATLPGVNSQDIVTYFSAVKRGNQMRSTGESVGTILNPDEKAAKKRVDAALKAQTGIDITGPGNLRNALIGFSQKYFADRSKDGGTGMSSEDINSLLKYNLGAQARQEFLSLEDKRKELVQKGLIGLKDPSVLKMTKVNPDGTKDFVNQNDVAKDIGDISLRSTTGQIVSFKSSTVGQAFLDNKLQLREYSSNNPYGGSNTYGYEATINDRSISLSPDQYYQLQGKVKVLRDKYGTPSEFQKKIKDFEATVIPNLPEYNNQTGKMGVNFQYQMDGKITKNGTEKGTTLVQEISQAGNRGQIFLDGEHSKDDKLNKVLTELGSLAEKDLEKYFSNVIYKTVGINGRPSIELKMAPIKSTDKTEVAGVDLNTLVGKTIEIAIAPGATGPSLNSLPKNEGNYIYNSLLRGKVLRSDPVMSSANFSYEILPDNTSNPTKAYVNIKRKQYNAKNGSYEDVVIPSTTIDFFGSNKKTPDELVAELYSMFQLHLNQNKNNEQVFKQKSKETNTMKSVSQIEQERQASKIGN